MFQADGNYNTFSLKLKQFCFPNMQETVAVCKEFNVKRHYQ